MIPSIVKSKVRPKADLAWKEALSVYFKSFTQLCWQVAFQDIEWEKGYEILEQELQTITEYPSPVGHRHVDKLIKVWKKSGVETWVLVHIEVQGQKTKDFIERLFVYRYRLHDRYRRPVATLVILTDNNKIWRPQYYRTELWGSAISLEFPVLNCWILNMLKAI
jgi:hypothetical protein